MKKEAPSYYVVFEYPEGTRYRTAFHDAQDFQTWLEELQGTENQPLAVPIAPGLTDEQSLALCRDVSIISRVRSAIRESTFDGQINEGVLNMEIETIRSVLAPRGKRSR